MSLVRVFGGYCGIKEREGAYSVCLAAIEVPDELFVR